MPPKKMPNSEERDARAASPPHAPSSDAPPASVCFRSEDITMLIDTLQRTQLDAFRELLDSVRQSATPTFDHRPANNFSRCKSVFSGRADESVEGFIDAIESYRDAANVPDDVAVKGISMLLTHTAATWWQGIKHQVSTWEDVISNLRSAFGDRRPPHRIYVDLFADGQQPMEKTDLFVARARALLAKLPRGDLCEKVELDMIYGLLHHKIRKRLRREEITSFNVLLQKARSIEDSTKEAHTSNAVAETSKGAAAARARLEPPRPTTQRVPTATVEVSPRQRSSGDNADATPTAEKPEKRRYCVYCKSYGHTRDQCRKLLLKQTANDSNDNVVSKVNNIKCYGCGASGVIRSNCSKCSSNFSAVDFIQIPRTRSRGTTTAETSAVGKPSAQVSAPVQPRRLRGRPRLVVSAEPLTRRSSDSEGEDITERNFRTCATAPAAALPPAETELSERENTRPQRARRRPVRYCES
ncbi:uncharacterized protein LOC134201416 [Bombyx mori]|uniref:uncharacterized protein LOC134201416 n=1 Tax=Bombyx mori TaxID=7091 RepID=UPI002ED08C07